MTIDASSALDDHDEDASATTTTVSRPPPPTPLSVLVRIVDGHGSPSSFRLKSGRCTIGSSRDCDIVLDDRTVSRTHVELELVPEGVRVIDLESRNRTFYLGQQIERAVLGLGATIQVGSTSIALECDNDALDDVMLDQTAFRGMVGVSSAMRRLFGTLTRLDGSLATVLVEGESGVGKELVANAIHRGSRVADGPFVTVNCGAVARDLVASELFGHRRGAFTGAIDTRKGAFESADGGTLFLDEIGEMPLDVQPMLLRAIEAREVRQLGADQSKPVRVRIVAATNRNLQNEVRAGTFRQDLYYRLAVVRIVAPPLRDRPEDVAPIAQRFAESAGMKSLPIEVVERLKTRTWPGNARELRNVIEAYAALGVLPDEGHEERAPLIEAAVALFADASRPYEVQKDALCELFARLYLQKLMVASKGNQSQAARVAKLDRSYLGRLLSKFGLRSSD